MKTLAHRDYFTDHGILENPYPYFEAIRAEARLFQPKGKDYYILTHYEDILEVLKNSEDFASIIAVQGADVPLPFIPQGPDISQQLEEHRSVIQAADLLVAFDDEDHSRTRALLTCLFTPSRLRANEKFMTALADRMVRELVMRGECELMQDLCTPFVTQVIADLLGVPEEDHQRFMAMIDAAPPPGSLNAEENDWEAREHPIVQMGSFFAGYLHDRKVNSRDDIMSELAHAKYADGSEPDLEVIIKLAIFLFIAGQDTSAKLLGSTMRFLVEDLEFQNVLRGDPSLIPATMEEVLRLDGPTKMTSRVARRDTQIGGVSIPAGTRVMLALSAGNRDPQRWDHAPDFQLKRPKLLEHVGFGRGNGAPLARTEVRVVLEKLLAHTSAIIADPAKHGEAGNLRMDYEPTFIIRGLAHLHLKLTPVL